jgi:hypothetical protein
LENQARAKAKESAQKDKVLRQEDMMHGAYCRDCDSSQFKNPKKNVRNLLSLKTMCRALAILEKGIYCYILRIASVTANP